MDLVTPSAYAAYAKVSKQAISKLILKGRIPSYDRDGRPVPADHRGERFVKPAEADRIRGASVRVDASAEEPVSIEPARGADPPRSGTEPNYARARTAVSAVQAQLLKITLDEKKGTLLLKEAVLAAMEEGGRAIARDLNSLVPFVEELVSAGMAKGVPEARRLMIEKIRTLQAGMVEHLSRADRAQRGAQAADGDGDGLS